MKWNGIRDRMGAVGGPRGTPGVGPGKARLRAMVFLEALSSLSMLHKVL